jgi:hypothetical protein
VCPCCELVDARRAHSKCRISLPPYRARRARRLSAQEEKGARQDDHVLTLSRVILRIPKDLL